MIRQFLLLVLLCLPLYLQGQGDSTVVLKEVQIENQHLKNYARGEHIEELSSTLIENGKGATLSDLLSQHAGINVRPYGLAGLATASIRGTGSNHTAVLWEGLNLQSITAGSADLSQIPVTFIDQVALQYGSGTAYGSGAMGGAIHLQGNQTKFENKPLSIDHTLQFGSFGSFHEGLNIKHTTDNLYLKARLSYQQAANNYSYLDESKSSVTLNHAATEKYGFLLESGYKLSSIQNLHAKYWYQNNYLETPESQDISIDRIHRGLIKYERAGQRTYIKAKIALLSNNLDYSSTSVQSNINAHSFITELIADTQMFPFWKLETTFNHNIEKASTKYYGANVIKRNRTAFTIINSWSILDRVSLDLIARQLMVDQSLAPFTPSLSMNVGLPFHFHLKSKIAKSYRIPTLNDLYWVGSRDRGNPDLKPEEGVTFDIGLDHFVDYKNKFTFKNSATVFYTNITNWIRWIDLNGWTPLNVDEMWSYGLELRGNYSFPIGQLNIHFSPTYNLVFAQTNKEASEKIISTDDKQTTYTPKHQGGGHFVLSYKNIQFSYSHSYTGLQFTDEENSLRWSLDPYDLSDASIKYQFTKSSNKTIDILFDVKNIFNENYQARRAYPMPGRNFKITIKYQINN